MSEDFYYALTTGWIILLVFWLTIIIFVYIRKPPKSKLTKKTIYKSVFFFIILFLIINFLYAYDSFFY